MTVADSRALTEVVTGLRRALRRSIRTEHPWEQRSVAQVEVLQTLADLGTARVGDLAERLRLAQSTVSTLIGALMSDGLVTRESDPSDRRASVLALTPAGAGEVRQWERAHLRRLERALGELSTRDRAAVLGAVPALARLVDAIDRRG
jgi:DNA-binding MarR family transcriptional regulator